MPDDNSEEIVEIPDILSTRPVFDEDQTQALIAAAIEGTDGATEEQIERFVAWCISVVTRYCLVELAMGGFVGVDVTAEDPEEYLFRFHNQEEDGGS